MEIHRASPSDWERLRRMRLDALATFPEAYGSTYERESAEGEKAWRAWATGWEGAREQVLFAAIDDGAWIGMALGLRWRHEEDLAHLYAMWVDPQRRGAGAGRALVEAVVAWARDIGVDRVRLGVSGPNPGAALFYERCGFADTGERSPLREGSPLVVRHMERPLSSERRTP